MTGRYVFVGNRGFVRDEMIARGLDLDRTIAIEGSYLHRSLEAGGSDHDTVASKAELVALLAAIDFDECIVNGCPFILPITDLGADRRRFVNIHPSPLPDLRGADPVPGSLLHRRPSGATAHLMDDGIDSGAIIARVVIPYSDDLDAGLLYQLSFLAEAEVFGLALERGFEPSIQNVSSDDCIYYTRHDDDLVLDFGEPTAQFLSRVRAWSNRSQGARFEHGGRQFKVYDAREVANPYLIDRIDSYRQNEVVFRYEATLLVRHDSSFLLLGDIEGDVGSIDVGAVLGAEEQGS